MNSAGDILHIFGASGSGTTALGRALAASLGCPHLDTDDFFWQPTDPPYTLKRTREERLCLIGKALEGHGLGVLSGALCGWGDGLIPRFRAAVFLYTPVDVRLERLNERELREIGPRILPGGELYARHQEFMAWAAQYDEGDAAMRSLARHDGWIAALPCPVLRLRGDCAIQENVTKIKAWGKAARFL